MENQFKRPMTIAGILVLAIAATIFFIAINKTDKFSCDQYYHLNNSLVSLERISGDDNIIFTNISDNAIMIRTVWQYRGETTRKISVLRPGDSTKVLNNRQVGVYISNHKGILIDFIGIKNLKWVCIVDRKSQKKASRELK